MASIMTKFGNVLSITSDGNAMFLGKANGKVAPQMALLSFGQVQDLSRSLALWVSARECEDCDSLATTECPVCNCRVCGDCFAGKTHNSGILA